MRNRCVIVFVAVTLIAAGHVAQAQDTRGPMVVAEGGAYSDPQAAQAQRQPTRKKTCRRKRRCVAASRSLSGSAI